MDFGKIRGKLKSAASSGYSSAKINIKSRIDTYNQSESERRQAYDRAKHRGRIARASHEGYRAGYGGGGGFMGYQYSGKPGKKKSSSFDGDVFGFGDMMGMGSTQKKRTPQHKKKKSGDGKNIHIHIHK